MRKKIVMFASLGIFSFAQAESSFLPFQGTYKVKKVIHIEGLDCRGPSVPHACLVEGNDVIIASSLIEAELLVGKLDSEDFEMTVFKRVPMHESNFSEDGRFSIAEFKTTEHGAHWSLTTNSSSKQVSIEPIGHELFFLRFNPLEFSRLPIFVEYSLIIERIDQSL